MASTSGTTLTAVSLTETDQLTLVGAVDWTDWTSVQSFRFPAGKGATSFLRTLARRMGLTISMQRAGDVIYLTLRWDGES